MVASKRFVQDSTGLKGSEDESTVVKGEDQTVFEGVLRKKTLVEDKKAREEEAFRYDRQIYLSDKRISG